MMTQWISIAIVLLIQLGGFVALFSRMNYIIGEMKKEVEALRGWRHDFGQKEMVYDNHTVVLQDHEIRLRVLERHA